MGFEIDQDDWFNQINTGQGKPKNGKTHKFIIGLSKDGKPVRKALAIQIHDMENDTNPYELNFYIS